MKQDKNIIIKNASHEKILNLESNYFSRLETIFKSQDFINNLLKMKKWINVNYQYMGSWNKTNKVQLPCQRIINYVVMKNLQQIIGVYNSAISSDIAFETNDAIINIDSKTVSSTGNKGDFNSLFFGPNQTSFKNKHLGISANHYPGLPVNFDLPSIDVLTQKPVLTFFVMIKYTDDGKKFNWYLNKDKPNIRFICIPNGELSYLFNNDIISNVKTYTYEKDPKNKKNDRILSVDCRFENFISIKIKSKKGFYFFDKKETWLETDVKAVGKKHLKRAISTHSCRIDFETLKDRYDSNKNSWNGVSNWSI